MAIIFNVIMYWSGNGRTFAYVNPIVIVGSLGLLLYFNNLKIKKSKIINWVAKSSFAVFLLHTNPNLGISVFQKYIKVIYNDYSGIVCIAIILLFLIIIYIAAVVLDQPRKYMWGIVSNHYFSK